MEQLNLPRRPPLGEPELSPELTKRLDALEEANRKLQRRQDEIDVDWTEWYDKFRLLFARLSKRIKDAAEAEEKASQPHQDAPGRTIRPLQDRARPQSRNYGG